MKDDLDLPKLRALCEAATPGPWTHVARDNGTHLTRGPHTLAFLSYRANARDEADAAFIAASRTAIPALLDRVEELQRENERLGRLAAQRWQDRYDALNVKSAEGLTSSEWILRTGVAERQRDEAQHERDACRTMLADLIFARKRAAMGEAMPAELWTRARELLKHGPKEPK